MKKTLLLLLTMLAVGNVISFAQNKVLVVVANRNVSYEDPRWGNNNTITKGKAISVIDDGSNQYEWWLYPAADVILAKKDFHVPGSIKGEKCIVINGTNVRFREKPSLQAGILCYNIEHAGSTYHIEFVKQSSVQKNLRVDGVPVFWDPYYLPKGTRLPYKGRVGDFYKTELNGMTLYISAKYCSLK